MNWYAYQEPASHTGDYYWIRKDELCAGCVYYGATSPPYASRQTLVWHAPVEEAQKRFRLVKVGGKPVIASKEVAAALEAELRWQYRREPWWARGGATSRQAQRMAVAVRKRRSSARRKEGAA